MRLRATAAALACVVVTGLGPVQGASDSDLLAADVRASAAILLAPEAHPGDPPAKALATLVRAVARLGKQSDLPEPFRSKMEAAVALVRDDRLPDDRTLQELRSAYAALNGGQPFAFPPDVRGLEAVKEAARRQADRGAAALSAGRNEEAAREILGFVLVVATPMEAP